MIGDSYFCSENLRAHIDLADVDKAARTELKLLKALAVGPQRHIVVDAGRHVAEMRGRHVLVHHRLEIEHVECFLRTRNQVLVVTRCPHERVGRPLRVLLRQRREARAGKQRTCGEELDETAAARGFFGGQLHDGRFLRILAYAPARAAGSILSAAVRDANERRRRTGLPPLQSLNQISIICAIDPIEGLRQCTT